MNLNLETKNKSDEILKAYLEKNATEELAAKINNGVRIQKDGKTLINRKTLTTFMTFATEEARKQAEKDATSACIEDKIVFGWLMHYFEENDIIGKLYNDDGTEYVPPAKKTTKTAAKTSIKTVKASVSVKAKPEPTKPVQKQTSLFDMMTASDNTATETEEPDEDKEPTEEEIAEAFAIEDEELITPTPIEPKYKPSPMYQFYLDMQEKYKDCLLFLRLGDFYEIFGDGAVTASKELDLTLTGRDVGLENRAPMAGLPYHAMDKYLAKLMQRGYKVALAEKQDDPNMVRIIQKTQKVDIETGEILSGNEEDYEPEELTEDEMRKFDGDIDDDIPTVSKVTESEADEELRKDKELVKAFDKDALCILSELFDGEINIA